MDGIHDWRCFGYSAMNPNSIGDANSAITKALIAYYRHETDDYEEVWQAIEHRVDLERQDAMASVDPLSVFDDTLICAICLYVAPKANKALTIIDGVATCENHAGYLTHRAIHSAISRKKEQG